MAEHKLDNIYRDMIAFCETPRKMSEIINLVGLSDSSVKHRVVRLIDYGYIEAIKPNDRNTRNWKYQATNKRKSTSPYKPLGMCVMGVWL